MNNAVQFGAADPRFGARGQPQTPGYRAARDVVRSAAASKMAKALKEAKESRMWLFMISQRRFFSEECTKPLLDEANAIVRILGKGVSTTRRRIANERDVANPMDKDEQ